VTNKLAQVAFHVKDVRKAAQDFHDVFGFGWVFLRNDELGENIAVSDAGVVLSENVDEANLGPILGNFAGGFLTAVEIKVPDRDAVHAKLLAKGVKPIFELWTPGGLREFYYDKTNFYDLPLVVTEYASDSFIEAIDENLEAAPEDYGVEMRWEPGYKPWSANGKTYPDFSGTLRATTDWRVAQVAFNVSGKLDAAIKDFEEIFGFSFVKVRQDNLGEWVAVSDGGIVLSEMFDESNPSQIAGNFGGGIVTALEIKVPNRDEVDRQARAKGIQPIFELWTPGGLREFYYDKTNFHDIPLVVTEYATDSFIEAIDENLEASPDDYAIQMRWEPGYSDWKPRE